MVVVAEKTVMIFCCHELLAVVGSVLWVGFMVSISIVLYWLLLLLLFKCCWWWWLLLLVVAVVLVVVLGK